MNLVSIGEILWDVFPNGAERLGGATFNFSAHASRLGHRVRFVSGIGADARGERALEEMTRLGVSSRYVRKVFDYPTGAVTIELTSAAEPSYALHRPAAYDFPALDQADLRELAEQEPEWVYYGTLSAKSPVVHAALDALLAALPHARRFYDVNLRKGSDGRSLVDELLRKATLVKLNEGEAARLSGWFNLDSESMEGFSSALCNHFHLEGVCVTLAENGCAIRLDGGFERCRGYRIQVHDAVGAGDAFAAALLHGIDSKWPLTKIGDFANRVGALIASRAGAIPDWTIAECAKLAL